VQAVNAERSSRTKTHLCRQKRGNQEAGRQARTQAENAGSIRGENAEAAAVVRTQQKQVEATAENGRTAVQAGRVAVWQQHDPVFKRQQRQNGRQRENPKNPAVNGAAGSRQAADSGRQWQEVIQRNSRQCRERAGNGNLWQAGRQANAGGDPAAGRGNAGRIQNKTAGAAGAEAPGRQNANGKTRQKRQRKIKRRQKANAGGGSRQARKRAPR